MVEDGCESSPVQTHPGRQTARRQRMSLGVHSVVVNSCLLVFFGLCLSPVPLAESYLLVMGFPATLLLFFCPDAVVRGHPYAFVAVYIVNFVVVSYCLGNLLSRIWHRASTRSLGKQNRGEQRSGSESVG